MNPLRSSLSSTSINAVWRRSSTCRSASLQGVAIVSEDSDHSGAGVGVGGRGGSWAEWTIQGRDSRPGCGVVASPDTRSSLRLLPVLPIVQEFRAGVDEFGLVTEDEAVQPVGPGGRGGQEEVGCSPEVETSPRVIDHALARQNLEGPRDRRREGSARRPEEVGVVI